MQKNGAWRIKEKDYHTFKTDYERIIFLLQYGMLAPSMHNTQPWSITLKGNRITFSDMKGRRLPVGDYDMRGYFFSIGCFIENMTIAGNTFKWDIQKPSIADKHVSISCRKVSRSKSRKTPNLSLEGIFLRKTNRSRYLNRKVASKALSFINRAQEEDVSTHMISGEKKDHLAEIIADGSHRALSKKAFRKELSEWMISGRSSRTTGMPMSSFNFHPFLAYFVPRILPFFSKAGIKAGKADFEMVKNYTPSILILSSKRDTSRDWLNTGKLFQRISVYAAKNKLYCHPLYGAIYDKKLRKKVSDEYCNGRFPQFISRIGYPFEDRPHTPRDNVQEHLVNN